MAIPLLPPHVALVEPVVADKAAAGCVMVCVAVAEHPLASVLVMMYEPGCKFEMVATVEITVLFPCRFQLYV